MLACETIKTLYGIPISFEESEEEEEGGAKKK